MRTFLPFLMLSLSCSNSSEQKLGIYNTAPNVSIITPVDGAVFDEGVVIVFEGIIGDDFDSPEDLTTRWNSDISGELTGGAPPDPSGTLLHSTANLAPGLHTITLVVLDSQQESTSASIAITITELPDEPEILIVHPTNGESGIELEPFEFVAEVFDAQDPLEQLQLSIQSDLDGAFCQTNSDEAGIASCEDILSVGTHLLTFTVTNTANFEKNATSYFDVIALIEIDNDGDGFTETQGDCDDADPSTSPSSTEVENGIDDNCDGNIDEGTSAFDDDGDCYCESYFEGACSGSIEPSCTTLEEGDCDDTDPAINPAATEICADGIDNDCNGSQNAENAIGCTTFYRDSDNDGFGDSTDSYCDCAPGGPDGSYDATNTLDCFDGNALANPQQSGFFSTHRGDGSFDFNCDNNQEKEYSVAGQCDSWGTNIGDCTLGTQGWDGGVPSCGASGNFLVDNDSCSAGCEFLGVPFCCEEGGSSYQSGLVQSCR